jgi:hypothetical protein
LKPDLQDLLSSDKAIPRSGFSAMLEVSMDASSTFYVNLPPNLSTDWTHQWQFGVQYQYVIPKQIRADWIAHSEENAQEY